MLQQYFIEMELIVMKNYKFGLFIQPRKQFIINSNYLLIIMEDKDKN